MPASFPIYCSALLLLGSVTIATAAEPVDFNRQIRPILSENCFYCHGQDGNKRQADLRLDVRKVAVELEAIVPGNVKASSLIDRIHADDPDERMPPADSNRRLSAEQKDLLKRWIAEGAPFQTHWAYETPQRPAQPSVKNEAWTRNPIDRFVLAKLDAEGLQPSPEAERATLIKRLSIDLIGLPPSLKEVDAFVKETHPQAYEKLVDRLLDSQHYGERMALSWLDAARYADSNGFQQDGDTWQWVWRDWVVKAMNDDLPYDQFTVWQLAGDLLPNATQEQKIASAFNRNHLLNGEGGAIAEEQRFNNLFDRIDTTATTWLGLTMACAQCHDHKYDPITQRDYYSLLDAFNRVPETGRPKRISSQYRVAPPLLEVETPDFKAHVAAINVQIEAAQKAEKPSDDTIKNLQKEIAEYRKGHLPRVMIMSDAKPRQSAILDRGEYLKPTEKVTFSTPAFLPAMPEEAPKNRLGLAHWLVAPEHPLTSRVMVNRIWQHHFGSGLVKTSEDFGVQSTYPIHKDLLDWLAIEFREKGWSMKHMHRLIVNSATYRQSSKMTPQILKRDSENRLYARASRQRMPSMVLRDWALASSGLLVKKIGGKPVYPYQPDAVWEALAITKERDFTYPASEDGDLYRRSIYTFWRRTVSPTNIFDAANRQACRVRQATTSTPLHALTTLNDRTWIEAARMLAERCLKENKTLDAQLTAAFTRVVCRRPTEDDLSHLQRAFQKQLAIYQADGEAAKLLLKVGAAPREETLNPSTHAAMTNLCLMIFNLDEALTRE